jgi:D-alanyl-lipoteichoic acid acyltransferase DltB (MBOAT superfamily)
MLIGGFWHGASWNFIFWGALHGGALAVEKLRNSFGRKHLVILPGSRIATKALATIITFHFVCLCWIFFRCDTFSDSGTMLHQIATNFQPKLLKVMMPAYWPVFVMLLLAFLLHSISNKREISFKQLVVRMPLALKIIYFFICLYIAIQFKQANVIKPIYLQF